MFRPTAIKNAALAVLTAPGVPELFAPLLRGRAAVFMLHRFAVPDVGVVGDDPAQLRRTLAYLRRHRYELLALPELVRRLQGQGPKLQKAVAFTLDDGYFDEVMVAGPVFAEFDCPATTFVTTGFLDKRLWNWWDKIEYVFEHCRRSSLDVELDGHLLTFCWHTTAERELAQTDFTGRCKLVANAEKLAAIEHLATAAEVDLPVEVPAKYAPVSWEQLRAAEARGMSFGPHTVTHPVLARTSDEESRREITESWLRLQAMAAKPVPVFCYPNGQLTDFGAREISTMREVGLVAAVVGTAGYANTQSYSEPDGPYLIHRFGLPSDMRHFIQFASGIERAKELVRELR
jgi:peptidoglycan/xylan/chitin deacetylase (PgdA/CDA1 family)